MSAGGDRHGIEKDGAVIPAPDELLERAGEYVAACAAECTGAKGRTRFPNLAGFCRALGVGVEVFRREMEAYPEVMDALLAVFEDEALNSSASPTIVSAYLKKRLGYEKEAAVRNDGGQIKIEFEHDIFEDGE